ncbi:uncharacterized protein LOC144678030, partial [Cetorhinus maximus]
RLCNGTERIWGGRVLYPEDRRAGGVLRYVCPGTQRAYPVSWRVCLPSGSWSPLRNAFREHSHAAKCLAYKCVGPTYIENGFFYPRKISYAVNETIEFECDQGFQLIGSRNRTCLPNGRWSGRTTVCDAGDSFCPDPGIPLGGSRRGNRFNEGDFVTYFCFTGLVLKGAERRRCDSSGRWQGTEATCEFPYSYDEPRIVAQKLTLSEEIINHAKQGSDLHIVVDASGSVGKENFEKSLRFIEIFSEMTTEISSGVGYFVVVFASKVLFARHYPPGFSIYVDRQELNYSSKDRRVRGGSLSLSLPLSFYRSIPPCKDVWPLLLPIGGGRWGQGPVLFRGGDAERWEGASCRLLQSSLYPTPFSVRKVICFLLKPVPPGKAEPIFGAAPCLPPSPNPHLRPPAPRTLRVRGKVLPPVPLLNRTPTSGRVGHRAGGRPEALMGIAPPGRGGESVPLASGDWGRGGGWGKQEADPPLRGRGGQTHHPPPPHPTPLRLDSRLGGWTRFSKKQVDFPPTNPRGRGFSGGYELSSVGRWGCCRQGEESRLPGPLPSPPGESVAKPRRPEAEAVAGERRDFGAPRPACKSVKNRSGGGGEGRPLVLSVRWWPTPLPGGALNSSLSLPSPQALRYFPKKKKKKIYPPAR